MVPNVLQEVELLVLDFNQCVEGYKNSKVFGGKLRQDSMICAGKVLGGQDTCNVSIESIAILVQI